MKLYIRISAVILAAALVYVLWVFWSRRQQNRAFQQRAAQKAAEQRARDQQTFEGMGGTSFAILSFFASPPTVSRGEESELCYSVSNAKTVSISPPVGDVWPAFDHCVSVKPRKTTTYTITITDASGHTKSTTAKLEVH
jgi:type II secretory pathway pseudopilin PulG